MGRRVTTTLTMLVLLAALGFMAVWGFKQATQPIKTTDPSASPTCSQAETSVQRFVGRGDIQVSVYNASTRKGLATSVLNRLEGLGFKPGEAANAPSSVQVVKAQVLTTKENDQAAGLVARTLGPGTRVVIVSEPLGPGVDIVVGQRFANLDRSAPSRVKLDKPVTSCVKVG